MGKNKQRRHKMESRFETHGDSSRCELLTNDVEKAKEFYRAISAGRSLKSFVPPGLPQVERDFKWNQALFPYRLDFTPKERMLYNTRANER
jgi:hypothetical protein